MSEEKKGGFFSKLKEGMKKTRDQIGQAIGNVFAGGGQIDDDFYDDVEAAMISADMGVNVATSVVEELRKRVRKDHLKTEDEVRQALREELSGRMAAEPFSIGHPGVILVVGVNGVGKTTSIGKLAAYYKESGQKVLVAAADTFRAAAAEQLAVWAQRADVDLIRHEEGSDPAAVVFDSLNAAKARKSELVIVDTAGRLHNKAHLMEELKKIRRVIDREYPDAQVKTLLVLDATTGQNGLNQAQMFKEAVGLDGIVLTKLDGTAKGGVAVAVQATMNLPVAFIGVGEGIDDMRPFDPNAYIEAII